MKSNNKNSNKRSISPLVPKVLETSQRKKKSNSNNPYSKVMKEFETYAKQDKNRYSKNQLRESIKIDDQKNKYRILTEPVDDKIMHLAKSNIFNNSYQKLSRSNKKIQPQQSQNQIRFQLRSSAHSRQKIKPIQCPNCQKISIEIKKYAEELEYLKEQLNQIIITKAQWKNGEISFIDAQSKFNVELHSGTQKKKDLKYSQALLTNIKKHFTDFMRDIDCLSQIDYEKMLQMDVFHYEPSFSQPLDHQYKELKELLGQLRYNIQGKIIDYDIEEFQGQNRQMNIMRNLKNRLGYTLRENIQLRAKKAILQKVDQISGQSEQYLKKVIEQVLISYSEKNKSKPSRLGL